MSSVYKDLGHISDHNTGATSPKPLLDTSTTQSQVISTNTTTAEDAAAADMYLRTDSFYHPPIKATSVVLKDGQTIATLHPISDFETQVPPALMTFLWEEFNGEIRRGDTYPQQEPMTLEGFKHYWFGNFGAIFIIGEEEKLEELGDVEWAEKVLGTFYIKPNFPGRSGHICNAGFVVNEYIRGTGVGRAMAELFLKWAPKLGYSYVMFNLVFETNVASMRIWDSLGFHRLGTIKGAGMLKGYRRPVNAIIYGRELVDDDYAE